MNLTNKTKDVFTNDLLLDNLAFVTQRGLMHVNWIDHEIYTNEESVNLVASGEYDVWNKIRCYSTEYAKKYSHDIVAFLHENEVEFFFNIQQIASADFGIKDGVIYVIFQHEGEYRMVPLDDFVKNNWDFLYEGSFNPLKKDRPKSPEIIL